MARLQRTLEVAESMADRRVLLTTMELARLNGILIGQESLEHDPWRKGPVTFMLPSGRTENLEFIADPKQTTREKLHHATELAESGSTIEGAVHIYAGLVMSHPFEDANRRTAAAAAHYFLRRYNSPLSGLALHEIGLGDLREEGQLEQLRETVRQMAKFALGKRPRT